MKVAVTFPDPERLAVDYLDGLLIETVGVNLPGGWTTRSGAHVQVAHDGTPELDWPAVAYATLRVTAWAGSTSAAKDLAGRAMALLLTHPGGGGVAGVRPLTGVLPTQDPTTRAPLASFTCRVDLRGVRTNPTP